MPKSVDTYLNWNNTLKNISNTASEMNSPVYDADDMTVRAQIGRWLADFIPLLDYVYIDIAVDSIYLAIITYLPVMILFITNVWIFCVMSYPNWIVSL